MKQTNFALQGTYIFKCEDANGKLKWIEEAHNIIPNEGLNAFLQVFFGKMSVIPNFYIGIYSGNYTPQATDTMATFPTNANEFSSFSETTRQQFVIPASISGTSVDNSASPAVFTATAAGTIYGGFLSTSSATNATTGILLSAMKFSSSKTLAIGDKLSVSYGVTALSS
jgi:hypothetical protein